MSDRFDVIVVGAGPAGEHAAGRLADGGLSVAIVERELIGGECSYWGCMPSKTLIRPGDVIAAARRVPGAAEAVTGSINVKAALARRDWMTSDWDDSGQVPWLDSKGIALVRGRGRLTGERTVEVEPRGGGDARRLTADKAVVLATGTSPLTPPIDGLADARPWDNRDVTEAKQLPRRLLVLGGGAVGTEMAQCYRRLGCEEVTVIEGAERLLAREEPFAGDEVREAFEAEGITVLTGTRMTAVRREGGDGSGPVVAIVGEGSTLVGDEILVAVGRRPAPGTSASTPSASPQASRSTSTTGCGRRVSAGAGCTRSVTATAAPHYMGKYHGRVAAETILGRDMADEASRSVMPRVTFTDPQVCAVGLSEAQAGEQGLRVTAVRTSTGGVPGAYTQGDGIRGSCQLVLDDDRRVLVGATFVGPALAELLHSATVAIAGRVPVDWLRHAVPSFPTVSEVWLTLLTEYGV